jgi:hypothetical protein
MGKIEMLPPELLTVKFPGEEFDGKDALSLFVRIHMQRVRVGVEHDEQGGYSAGICPGNRLSSCYSHSGHNTSKYTPCSRVTRLFSKHVDLRFAQDTYLHKLCANTCYLKSVFNSSSLTISMYCHIPITNSVRAYVFCIHVAMSRCPLHTRVVYKLNVTCPTTS